VDSQRDPTPQKLEGASRNSISSLLASVKAVNAEVTNYQQTLVAETLKRGAIFSCKRRSCPLSNEVFFF
jgi:hypothetical protein